MNKRIIQFVASTATVAAVAAATISQAGRARWMSY